MKQFVLDESGLNDLLYEAFKLGIKQGIDVCEPDLWMDTERRKELEKATKKWLGYKPHSIWLVGDVFNQEGTQVIL